MEKASFNRAQPAMGFDEKKGKERKRICGDRDEALLRAELDLARALASQSRPVKS